MIKNIIFGILILGFLASILFLNIPMVQGVLGTRKEIEFQQEKLNQKTEFINMVEDLIEKYKANQGVLQRLDLILPNDKDIPNLLVQIEALANDGGIILNDVVIVAIEEKTGSRAQEIRTGEAPQERTSIDYKIISINLKLSANYESFKNFLKAVENNLRIVDIDSIGFSSQTKEDDGVFDFDVALKTYYQIVN